MEEILKKSATEQRKALLNKEISAVELAEATFKRIDEVEPKVKAFNSLTKETAMETAKKLMKNRKRRRITIISWYSSSFKRQYELGWFKNNSF